MTVWLDDTVSNLNSSLVSGSAARSPWCPHLLHSQTREKTKNVLREILIQTLRCLWGPAESIAWEWRIKISRLISAMKNVMETQVVWTVVKKIISRRRHALGWEREGRNFLLAETFMWQPSYGHSWVGVTLPNHKYTARYSNTTVTPNINELSSFSRLAFSQPFLCWQDEQSRLFKQWWIQASTYMLLSIGWPLCLGTLTSTLIAHYLPLIFLCSYIHSSLLQILLSKLLVFHAPIRPLPTLTWHNWSCRWNICISVLCSLVYFYIQDAHEAETMTVWKWKVKKIDT